jgi:trehalose 6-phosphate phosphatase
VFGGYAEAVDPLDQVRRRPAEAGVVTDFDGTLSAIAPTPEAARAVAGAREALGLLATTYAVVAVLSGRRAEEVASLLEHPPGVRVLGLYGLEDRDGPMQTRGTLGAVAGVLPDVERIAWEVSGARVERKGAHVAVHYRGADDPARAHRTLLRELGAVAGAAGLRVLEGKKVIELAPADGPTKGDAVRRLVERHGLRAVLYAGDDLADIDAFHTVEALRAEGLGGVTVAVRSAETPAALLHRADVVAEGPGGMLEVLRALAPD